MKDNLYLNDSAQSKLISGITKCAMAVGNTMGTAGNNTLIQTIENPGHLITNDGFTILNSIRLADSIEDEGRKIILEAVSKANKQSGDGSSTTTVLTYGIIKEGLQYKDKIHPMDIKRSLEACIPLIEKSLNQQTTLVTVDDVKNVASIAAEDEKIGALIQEIYKQIGIDGIIHWDISKTTEDSYKINNGLVINDAGYISPYLCDLDEKTGQFLNQIKWSDAHVLLVKEKITTASDFNSLFSDLFASDVKEIVVFCDEIEATIIPDLLRTRSARGFKTMLVKMPVLFKDQWYEDLAIASGATVISTTTGVTLKTMNMSHTGTFGNIIVTQDQVFIDGIKDITEHLKRLNDENTDDSLLRASRLNTKTARLYIGEHSESALSYKRLKIEDAISAAWQALHGGIVPGGGTSLITAARSLPNTPGGKILKEALKYPAKQIATNAGYTDVEIDNRYTNGMGFDTRSHTFVNMLEANIVNPKMVELNAIKNAISVAATVLTTPAVILLPQTDERI